MKLKTILRRLRNDVWVDLVCEFCGHLETDVSAYDDAYYWYRVLPTRKCPACGKASDDKEEDRDDN